MASVQIFPWDVRSLVEALKPILRHQRDIDVFLAVPKDVVGSIIALAAQHHEAVQGFDTLRIDLNPQRLVVQRPNRWDFIPRTIFSWLIKHGQFDPSRLHNGFSLVDIGEVEESQYVHLCDGMKSPVYRIHQRTGHESEFSFYPSFVVEVGLSRNKKQLQHNAARYICMSQGAINIAATLELDFGEVANPSGYGFVLRKAVWSHWRLESEEVVPQGFQTNQTLQELPPSEDPEGAPRYQVTIVDHEATRYVAVEEEVFQIWPIPPGGDEVEAITLFYDDLHENPQGDNEVAVRIPLSLIREIIAQHCASGPNGWLYSPEEDEYPVRYLGGQ